MKKCCLCRRELMPGSSAQCDKCKKNEAKYGKPTECIYCKLPAAFVDRKCVYCAHSERKCGPPQPCHKCRSKSAFVRDSSKAPKMILCRLCQAVHGSAASSSARLSSGSQHRRPSESESSAAKKSRTEQSHSHLSHSSSSIRPLSLSAGSTASGNPTDNSQALKDKIEELHRQLLERNQTIKNQQQKIVELEAIQMQKDTSHRQKLLNVEKQHDSAINGLQDQIKQLNKELATKRSRH